MDNREIILLIHLFSNGDCLFATVVARQIKNDFPGCKLVWAISGKCKSIILNNPYVDEIEEVSISNQSENLAFFERFIKESFEKKNRGLYSRIFVSQVLGDNFSKYDGIVCTSIYRCYGRSITVDTTPILSLTEGEKLNAQKFAIENRLSTFKNVVLFECAPQSSQLNLTRPIIQDYCLRILEQGNTCVILSAPTPYQFEHPNIIDGNTLSIRETVGLTHFCTLLLGCSSGISWAATSTAAHPLPMIQILEKDAYYFNPMSITFEKLQKSTEGLIELIDFDSEKLRVVFKDIFNRGFEEARRQHNQKVTKQFRLYRGIIHHFLRRGKFSLIADFLSVNFKANGLNLQMIKYMFYGLLLFPFQVVKNLMQKAQQRS
jgi:hypothetical protein